MRSEGRETTHCSHRGRGVDVISKYSDMWTVVVDLQLVPGTALSSCYVACCKGQPRLAISACLWRTTPRISKPSRTYGYLPYWRFNWSARLCIVQGCNFVLAQLFIVYKVFVFAVYFLHLHTPTLHAHQIHLYISILNTNY